MGGRHVCHRVLGYLPYLPSGQDQYRPFRCVGWHRHVHYHGRAEEARLACYLPDGGHGVYHEVLGFPIIRSNFRQDRQDWKIDLRINETTELELFIMSDRPARVTDPEAYGLRHLAFQVSSGADTVAELENAGIPCEPVRLDAYTGNPMTFFRDPDGLPIEIHE